MRKEEALKASCYCHLAWLQSHHQSPRLFSTWRYLDQTVISESVLAKSANATQQLGVTFPASQRPAMLASATPGKPDSRYAQPWQPWSQKNFREGAASCDLTALHTLNRVHLLASNTRQNTRKYQPTVAETAKKMDDLCFLKNHPAALQSLPCDILVSF